MVKKGKWSKEEDDLLKNHIEKYGIGRSWQALSNTLGLQRCGRSCRSRWLNYLRPGLKHGGFTLAEERIICEMYRQRGSCWSVIAAQLPGRTDLAIKNYWNSTLKKKLPGTTAAAACGRRTRLASSSTSFDAGTPAARDLQLVAYGSEESSTAESSAVKPVLPCPTHLQVRPLVPVGATGQHQAWTVPVSEPVRIEEKPALVSQLSPEKKTLLPLLPPPSPPDGDQTADWSMDLLCAPISPIPLSVMDPPKLACFYQFDDIDDYLAWFDHH